MHYGFCGNFFVVIIFQIVTYPRSIPGTVRALDEKRTEKRRARDERKQMVSILTLECFLLLL